MTKPTGRPHGGRRAGAGRKPSGAVPDRRHMVRLPEAVEAELVAGLEDGETLADVLRDGALALVRGREAGRRAKRKARI